MPSRKPKPRAPLPPRIPQRNEPLTLAELKVLAETFARIGTRQGTAVALKMSRTTVNRYLDHGDPKRGIAPLLGAGGVLPVGAPAGPPNAPEATHTPTDPPAGPPGAPGALGGGALPAAQVRPPPPLPSPLPPPQAQALQEPGLPPKGVPSIDHTVPIANAELVRLSRNARNIFNLKNRILAKVADRLQKPDPHVKGGGARLTATERDLLMVTREIRVTAFDVDKLYCREVVILGVNAADAGKGRGDEGEEGAEGLGDGDAATLDELRAQLAELTSESSNLRATRGR